VNDERNMESSDTERDQTNPKEKPYKNKPKKSRLQEWNRSRVKHNDRNGRWDSEED